MTTDKRVIDQQQGLPIWLIATAELEEGRLRFYTILLPGELKFRNLQAHASCG